MPLQSREKRLIVGNDVLDKTLSNTQVGLASTKPVNFTGAVTTTSTTAVMAGYGASSTPTVFTPLKTGIIEIHCTYQTSNNTNNDGVQIQLAYGTGTAPSAGAAQTGTTIGSKFQIISSSVNAYEVGAVTDVITGTTIGTQIWIDIQYAAITGGTASLGPATFVIKELLA